MPAQPRFRPLDDKQEKESSRASSNSAPFTPPYDHTGGSSHNPGYPASPYGAVPGWGGAPYGGYGGAPYGAPYGGYSGTPGQYGGGFPMSGFFPGMGWPMSW